MKKLGLEIPQYSNETDPTKSAENIAFDWTIKREDISEIKQLFSMYCKRTRKRKRADKNEEKTRIKQNVFIKPDCEIKSSDEV